MKFIENHLQRFATEIKTWLAGSQTSVQVTKSSFWSLSGGLFSHFFAFLASIWLAQTLGGDQFGQYAIVRSTAMMFSVLAAFGIGMTATRHIALYLKMEPERAGRIVVLAITVASCFGLAMALLLFVIASPVARYILHAPHLTHLLRIGCLLLVLNTVSFAQAGVLAGLEAFKEMAWVGISAGIISFSAILVASTLAGLEGALWGAAIGQSAHCILNLVALNRKAIACRIPLSFKSTFCEWRTLLSFSAPVAFTHTLRTAVIWMCHALLVGQVGGYLQMGVFNIANQWSMALLFIPQRISLVVFPILSSLNTKTQLKRYSKTLKLTVLLNACVSLIPALFIILLSKFIIQFYGSDFETGAETLSLMALCAVVASITMIGDRALVSRGRVWQRFLAQAISSTVLLVTAHSFIRGGAGAEGLALAFFLSGCLHIMIVFGFMTRFHSNEKKQPLLKDSTGVEAGECDGRYKV